MGARITRNIFESYLACEYKTYLILTGKRINGKST